MATSTISDTASFLQVSQQEADSMRALYILCEDIFSASHKVWISDTDYALYNSLTRDFLNCDAAGIKRYIGVCSKLMSAGYNSGFITTTQYNSYIRALSDLSDLIHPIRARF